MASLVAVESSGHACEIVRAACGRAGGRRPRRRPRRGAWRRRWPRRRRSRPARWPRSRRCSSGCSASASWSWCGARAWGERGLPALLPHMPISGRCQRALSWHGMGSCKTCVGPCKAWLAPRPLAPSPPGMAAGRACGGPRQACWGHRGLCASLPATAMPPTAMPPASVPGAEARSFSAPLLGTRCRSARAAPQPGRA